VAIWEPHAQNSLDALGSNAVVLQDPSVYQERFNLNTTTKVLSDPGKRHSLVEFLRMVRQASKRARKREAIASLAPFIGAPEKTIERVWSQFRFPANLPVDLAPLLGDVERFVAESPYRPTRSLETLFALIDASLLTEAKQ